MTRRWEVEVERSTGARKDDDIGVNVDGSGCQPVQQKLFVQNVFAVLDEQAFNSHSETFNGLYEETASKIITMKIVS